MGIPTLHSHLVTGLGHFMTNISPIISQRSLLKSYEALNNIRDLLLDLGNAEESDCSLLQHTLVGIRLNKHQQRICLSSEMLHVARVVWQKVTAVSEVLTASIIWTLIALVVRYNWLLLRGDRVQGVPCIAAVF